MIIDIILDQIVYDCEFDLDEWIRETHYWGYELKNTDKNFVAAVRKLHKVLTADVINLWDFKMACLDYMKQAGYKGSAAWNKFGNMSLRRIGKKMKGVRTIERDEEEIPF